MEIKFPNQFWSSLHVVKCCQVINMQSSRSHQFRFVQHEAPQIKMYTIFMYIVHKHKIPEPFQLISESSTTKILINFHFPQTPTTSNLHHTLDAQKSSKPKFTTCPKLAKTSCHVMRRTQHSTRFETNKYYKQRIEEVIFIRCKYWPQHFLGLIPWRNGH